MIRAAIRRWLGVVDAVEAVPPAPQHPALTADQRVSVEVVVYGILDELGERGGLTQRGVDIVDAMWSRDCSQRLIDSFPHCQEPTRARR